MQKKGKFVVKTVPVTTNNITTGIINHLRSEGHGAWRINTQGQWDEKLQLWRPSGSDEGVSDVISCIRPIGLMFGIEVKFKHDRLKDAQKDFIATLVECGGVSCVAKTYEGYLEFYNEKIKPLIYGTR